MREINLQAQIDSNSNLQTFEGSLSSLKPEFQTEISTNFIYAISPSAEIKLLPNGNYLIVITDKNGTTSAEITNTSEENINRIIDEYLQNSSIISQYIEQHDISEVAHASIRALIQDAINRIPKKISQLINDKGYIVNFKDLLKIYDSYYDFPNIPKENEKDMIFVDNSTKDMYVFGLNNSLTYTSIGISNQDSVYGGDSSV